MIPEQRRAAILELARQKNELTVDEIAGRFGVSRETIRRDLAHLDERGLLRRVHGGALQLKTAAEAAFHERLNENAEAKTRIGRAAAGLFEENDTIMIDTGSTTEAFALELASMSRLTIITNSVRIASRFWAEGTQRRVYVLGGEFRGETGQMLGSLCLEQIAGFRADHAVLGTGAISASGDLMDFDVEEALVARAMVKHARQVTILADHSKFDRVALVRTCTLDDVAHIVTDAPPPAAIAHIMALKGVQLIVAP